jgi:DNA-binding NtrC family response regulator
MGIAFISTVFFSHPVRDACLPQASSLRLALPRMIMPKETILILDNEPHIQWALNALFENEGYSIAAANTIEQALNHLSNLEVAGLVTEYQIDHLCTRETILALKKKFPEAYVMVLTNSEVKENQYKAIIDAGVDDFFQKPVSSERILLHLRKGLKVRELLLQKNRLEQEMNRMKTKGISWAFHRKSKKALQLENHP